jgi:hypothetical protein
MGDAQTTAGLPRRCAPRNDKRWGVVGEVGRVTVFGRITCAVIASPFRAWQSGLLTFMSLRGRSRRELTWQSSLRRHAGCRDDAVGCRTRSAGLPRRCAPRNDNGGSGGRGGFRPAFRMRPTTLSLRARQGVAIRSPHFYVIARKVSKRTDVAIQSEALCGMPGRCGGRRGRCGGLPDAVRWIAASLRSSQ